MKRRRFLQITASALALPKGAAASEQLWQGRALGADVAVTLFGDAQAGRAAIAAIPGLLAEIEREFSLLDPTSALTHLNATGHLAAPSPRFTALCTLCDQLHMATRGTFDPSVQPLWRALADGGDIAAAQSAIGWHRVKIGPSIALGAHQALTFNGIAQGAATDAVRALLAQAGFTKALINIGEFAAIGGPFTLGIADPTAGLLAQRHLTDRAIATSSPGALTIGGRPHILHPTGKPALWSTVSVEAKTAALADGCSTAFVFATVAQMTAIRSQLPGIGRIVLVDAQGDLQTI